MSIYSPESWDNKKKQCRVDFFKDTTSIFRSDQYARAYCKSFDELLRSCAKEVYFDLHGTTTFDGVAIFSFGAPARNEMLGCSDVDAAVYRVDNSAKHYLFRDAFVKKMEQFSFTKVDTPEWGSMDDIHTYLSTSVTEANQILEAQFICGDEKLLEYVLKLRSAYPKPRIARNLLFQFAYFSQYYLKKLKTGQVNLKYCSGGTRDFLFPSWYSYLVNGIPAHLDTLSVFKGIETLSDKLNDEQLREFKKAVSAIAFIRDELMHLDKKDIDGTVSKASIENLYAKNKHLFSSEQEIYKLVEINRRKVADLKNIVWLNFLDYLKTERGDEWFMVFEKETCQGLIEEKVSAIPHLDDEELNIARLWNSKSSQNAIFPTYLDELKTQDSWVVLASILSQTTCPGKIINEIVERIGFSKGYEYLLEIVTRNPNTELKTLDLIVQNKTVESRFKKAAKKKWEEVFHHG
ncbi:hypothetical protein HY485_04970 [Candidatus Woesearchaeota archaeon]|nr:hypothetical protein [Candidatus Woesearchaeota archaeon]